MKKPKTLAAPKSLRAEHVSLDEEAERQQSALECKRAALEGQIATLRAEFSAEEAEP